MARLILLQGHLFDQGLINQALENTLIANAEKTQKRANLANRLLNGLGGEGVRWQNEVAQLDNKMRLLVGDVMLVSSFVAYIAPFSRQFREANALLERL